MRGFARSKTVFTIDKEHRWNGIPTIEVGEKRTLLAAWYSGGTREPEEENKILFCRSFDDGESWEYPVVLADPPGPVYAFDPCLWIDPLGRLWLSYNTAEEAVSCEVWYRIAARYEEEGRTPDWSPPRKIEFGRPFAIQLNKRIVLDNGDWLAPTNFRSDAYRMKRRPETIETVGVVASRDRGKTWQAYGDLGSNLRYTSEPMVIQKLDGSLWMLARTRTGVLWQSTSDDRGRTWVPLKPTNIVNPSARFYLGRLASGNVMLVNTPLRDRRDLLVAYLSENDGESWRSARTVDDRQSISYPDAKQDSSGLIHMVFDYKRREVGAIEYRAFTEEWIES